MQIVAQAAQSAVKRDYSEVFCCLATVAANELAAQSKGQAIALQAPNDCDEIHYSPGPPTQVFYKDRRTGVVRIFKFTLQWRLVEIGGRE